MNTRSESRKPTRPQMPDQPLPNLLPTGESSEPCRCPICEVSGLKAKEAK